MKTKYQPITHTFLGFWLALLLLPALAHAQGVLSNGGNHEGYISTNDVDSWTFTAQAGDYLALSIRDLNNGTAYPYLQLLSPSGVRIGGNYGNLAARFDHRATANGTYTVLVSDWYSTGTADYRLHFAKMPGAFTVADEGGTLANGANHPGSLPVGDLDQWSFTAQVGDYLALSITDLTNGTAYPLIQLFDPEGAYVVGNYGNVAARIDHQATANGTYTVLVSDWYATGTADYRLHFARMPGAFTVADEGGSVTNGANHHGSLPSGDLDQWSFTANVGDYIALSVTDLTNGTAYPFIQLFDPSGTYIVGNYGNVATRISHQATANGTYTVLVSDWFSTGTADYRLHFAKMPGAYTVADEGGGLANGANHPGSLPVGDLDQWSFTAQVGDYLALSLTDLTNGTAYPLIQLFDPEGNYVVGNYGNVATRIDHRATVSGTYTVLVSDWFSTGTADYRLHFAKMPGAFTVADEGGTLANGANHPGSLPVGDLDQWSFTAQVGDYLALSITDLTNGTAYPYIELFNPSGVRIGGNYGNIAARFDHRATANGTYTVLVSDWFSTGTADYRLHFAKMPGAFTVADDGGALTNGANHHGSLPSGDLDQWTFTAQAGDHVALSIHDLNNGSAYPYIELFNPSGVRIGGNYGNVAARFDHRVTANGTYTVLVSDWFSTGAADYRLHFAKMPGAFTVADEGGALANGANHHGSLPSGDLDQWSFTASVGDYIALSITDLTNGSAYPYIELFNPSGLRIGGNYGNVATRFEHQATASGTYTVLVSDWFSTGAADYRLVLAKTGGPVSVSPGDQGGALNGGTQTGQLPAGDMDVWTFDVCEGEPIFITMTELVNGSTLSPWLQLYGRDGLVLNSVSHAASAVINRVAPATGTYTLIVGDANLSAPGQDGYQLSTPGLVSGPRLCPPILGPGGVVHRGVGGPADTNFILLSTTNLATPSALWTRVLTNRFSGHGEFGLSNAVPPGEPHRFYQFMIP